jgi:hypothetical protein
MAVNRFRKKEKLRRQYTLTKTKAFAAFMLSLVLSLLLDTYFDRYGPDLLAQIASAIHGEPNRADENLKPQRYSKNGSTAVP